MCQVHFTSFSLEKVVHELVVHKFSLEKVVHHYILTAETYRRN